MVLLRRGQPESIDKSVGESNQTTERDAKEVDSRDASFIPGADEGGSVSGISGGFLFSEPVESRNLENRKETFSSSLHGLVPSKPSLEQTSKHRTSVVEAAV